MCADVTAPVGVTALKPLIGGPDGRLKLAFPATMPG
jgi:hypothetical protein